MTVDDVAATQLAEILGARPVATSAVGGGCISPASRVTLADGRVLFLKGAPAGAPADLFREESRSLERLRAAGALRVPEVIAVHADWLALEWLEPVGSVDGARLGRGLAALHRTTGDAWGWDADNYIGPLPQPNGAAVSWPAFWRDRRLHPQMERATLPVALRRDLDRLLADMEVRLDDGASEPPSLLHGDLWSGNVHPTAEGPALIDPASFYGHREVDLAMAALFGGVGDGFERAYEAEWPLRTGAAVRRAIYQLYYLLVHVNLFGAGYIPATARAVRAALS